MTSIKQRGRTVLKGLGLEGRAMRARDRQRARRARSHDQARLGPDGLPVPPGELIWLVTGSPDLDEFLRLGAAGQQGITATLARNGVDIARLDSLLDFGVGCGRVARHWAGIGPDIHGSDYNPEPVKWCAANLPHVTAVRNRLEPPLPYDDARFDFIYALSVFTHLTEPQQRSWSAEVRRVTRVGGVVLFTTHGPKFPHGDPSFSTPQIAARLERGELVVFEPGHAGRNYCAALHPRSWVEENMLDGFELLEYVECGSESNPGQDQYLVRRTS
jgi:SAM-dependent methyltransferase